MARELDNGRSRSLEGSVKNTRLSAVIFFLLLLVPAIGTILFGAVDEITWALISLIWVILVVLWAVDGWTPGDLPFNASPLLLPLVGFTLIGLVQLLPITVLGSIDPRTTYFFEIRLLVLLVFFAGYLTFINSDKRLRRTVNFVV